MKNLCLYIFQIHNSDVKASTIYILLKAQTIVLDFRMEKNMYNVLDLVIILNV